MNKKTATNIPTSFVGGFALGVAGACALVRCVSGRFVNVALSRSEGKSIGCSRYLISRVKLDDAVRSQIIASADKLRRDTIKDVEIVSHDGEVLAGHIRECKNARRIIIAMHGWRSDWATDFGAISDFWQRQGCEVLYAEQRGQYGSGGKCIGFGMTERYDCADWVRYVNTRTGGTLPIYLAGLSMGAATVLMASDLAMPDNVCGIIADSGYTSPYAIWKYVVERNLHFPYWILKRGVNRECRRRLNMLPDDFSAPEALSATSIPILIIHGSKDKFVPVTMAYDNYISCKSPKHILVVPGAEHCASYFTETEKYEQAVIDFWENYDKSAEKK